MHIKRIEIERFGALANVTIDSLGPGLQVLHGTNETGKTSLLEFVRAVFFGFEGLFRRGVLDPQLPCAGRLVVRSGAQGQQVSIERRHEGPHIGSLTRASYEDDIIGLGGDHGDFVNLADLDPQPDGRNKTRLYLQDIVGDIDEKTFTTVMAFGLDELHELRTLDPEGCGSRLYELASGLDRSGVARVLTHLRDAILRLDSSDPTISPLEALRLRHRDAIERLTALQSPALAAGGVNVELIRLDHQITAFEGALDKARHTEGVVRGVLLLEPLFARRQATARELSALQDAPLVHGDLDQWKRALRIHKRCVAHAHKRKRTRSRLARELKAIPAESMIWEKRAAITGLCDELPRLERLVGEVARADSHALLASRRFGEHIGSAGLSRLVRLDRESDGEKALQNELLLPEGFTRSFTPLRSRARDCAAASREVARAAQGVSDAQSVLENARGLPTRTGGEPAGVTIAEAIEQASGRATLLRNRLSAGEHLIELEHSITRLESELGVERAGQLIPIGWLVGLGAVFMIGAGMLLSGLLLPTEITGSLAYAMAALGLAGTGLASVTTWSLDRTAATRLAAIGRQCDMVRKQRDETFLQCGQLDKRIPADATASLERRVALALGEVDRLEQLAAREGSVHGLADKVTLAEQNLKRAVAVRKAARLRWKKALHSRGLPVSLSPNDVRQIGNHRHTLLTLDDDRRRLSEEARQKREELSSFSHRINQMMEECDLAHEATPLEHLRQLRECLDTQTLAVRRREQIARQLERSRLRHRQSLRLLKHADRGLQAFFTRWSVANEKDFLAKVDRRPHFAQAKAHAETAEIAWNSARRTLTEPTDPEAWLLQTHLHTLEERLADACATTLQVQASLTAAVKERIELLARVAHASGDHCTEALQAELADIELQRAGQLDRRRMLERAHIILEETRAIVARDHQPPVLREASYWLSQLTEGRYTSITTTIEEARLEVHESDGQTWSPERLSRGTREQVFLALRLALVRDLERHGIQLPIVMDDALVNFDDRRATAAARVLCEFLADNPSERQMLVLTCHSHVAAIFAAAGANVRSLSDALPAWLPQPSSSKAAVKKPPRRSGKSIPVLSAEPAPETQPVQNIRPDSLLEATATASLAPINQEMPPEA